LNQSHQPHRLALIVPVYNETPDAVSNLRKIACLADIDEMIISDASDSLRRTEALDTLRRDHSDKVRVLHSDMPQRAAQMNLASANTTADILWFVHADTTPPSNAARLIRHAIGTGNRWGRFDVEFDNPAGIMKVVAMMMNRRSALSGICTGDQAMFIEHNMFRANGGFPAIPLMEDVSLSKRLKRAQRPARIRTPVLTSARRWEKNGYVRTIALMWTLRLLHSLGVSATTLQRMYGN